ncbi:MAG TPA: hypothetical protein PLM63_04015 [bacterium]|nr:hypothetical protein [bacterium]
MKINELVKLAHENAVAKGFWDSHNDIKVILSYTSAGKDVSKLITYNINTKITSKIMLIVSELGESVEALRNGKHARLKDIDKEQLEPFEFERLVKDTFEDEIADVFIRLCDLVGFMGFDIERYIQLKMDYNKSREYLHGKEF